MGSAFLITLREGLEIALVLAILVSYLVKTGRRTETTAVWQGLGSAVLVCIVVGIVVHAAVGGLHGTAEQLVEGIIATVAAVILTWMIFWMRTNARNMGAELRGKVDAATTVTALVVVAFVATIREGLETVLFLLSAETGNSSGTDVVIGGLAGLAVSAVLGVLVYKGGNRMNLKRFFQVTGILLILFAAGLIGKAFHEFREALGFESGVLIDPVWTVKSGVWADGTFYDFMNGFFGWHNEAELIRVVAYFAYLVPVLYLFVKPAPKNGSAPTPQATLSKV